MNRSVCCISGVSFILHYLVMPLLGNSCTWGTVDLAGRNYPCPIKDVQKHWSKRLQCIKNAKAFTAFSVLDQIKEMGSLKRRSVINMLEHTLKDLNS